MHIRFKNRHQWDDDADAVERKNTNCHNDEPSLTQQHFQADTDLNTIVKRYGIGDGAIPPAALDPSYFGDFTEVGDFRDALDRTREATERFDALPATTRNLFNNDPVQLWNWVTDIVNADEAVELGLLQKRPVPDQNSKRPPLEAPAEKTPPVKS